MRITALIGAAAVVAACTSREAPPADTTAMVPPPAPPSMSMSSLAGMWNVNVMPPDRDTVLTSYVLDATDSTAWKFTFTGRTDVIPMRVTGMSGDTLLTEAGPFDSGVRAGQRVSVKAKNWVQDGQIISAVESHYEGTPADSIVRLRSVATRR